MTPEVAEELDRAQKDQDRFPDELECCCECKTEWGLQGRRATHEATCADGPRPCAPSRPAVKGTPFVVSTANCAPSKMVNPSTIQSPGAGFTVEVTDHDIRGHTTTAFSAHLRNCPLQRKTPLDPQTSAHAARWWPRQSRRRPHRQVQEERRMGRWSVGTTTLGTAAGRLASETWRMPPRHCPPSVISTTPVLDSSKFLPLGPHGKRAANFCNPCLGSTGLSSSSFCPGRKPATTASHVGTSNCASRNVFAHSRTASKLGASWWLRKLTIASATSGCLRFTLGMPSAQVAQCAASAAKHKPKPPKFMGTPAASSPPNWQKHCHIMSFDKLLG